MCLGRLSTIVVLATLSGTACCTNCHSQESARSPIVDMNAMQVRIDNTIRERGIIECSQSVEVRCEVKAGSVIFSIVPEGARVSKGDLLVELDDTALRAQLAPTKIATKQAMASLEQARAKCEAAKVENETRVQMLEGELHVAELEHRKILGDGGELACQLATAQAELATAKKRLEIAQAQLQRTPGDRGENSNANLQFEVFEAREAIKVAKARKRYLEQHERPYQTALLDGVVAQKKLAIERQKRHLRGALHSAEAQIMVEQTKVTAAQEKLHRIQEQIENCQIVAPREGVVLHAADSSNRRTAAVEPGETVNERQLLLRICDLSKLQVRVLVNESRVSRARAGQPAKIVCNALPDQELGGRVEKVSDVPEPSSWRSPDVKQYAVVVSINEPVEALRIGLTALVEIDASDHD